MVMSMTSARWPNGNWNDGSVWDKTRSPWHGPKKGKGAYGHHYNDELAQIDGDLTGAIIMVNSGSFKTFKSHVTEHSKGADNFKYDTTKKEIKVHFSYQGKVERHGYFPRREIGLVR